MRCHPGKYVGRGIAGGQVPVSREKCQMRDERKLSGPVLWDSGTTRTNKDPGLLVVGSVLVIVGITRIHRNVIGRFDCFFGPILVWIIVEDEVSEVRTILR